MGKVTKKEFCQMMTSNTSICLGSSHIPLTWDEVECKLSDFSKDSLYLYNHRTAEKVCNENVLRFCNGNFLRLNSRFWHCEFCGNFYSEYYKKRYPIYCAVYQDNYSEFSADYYKAVYYIILRDDCICPFPSVAH